MALKDIRAALAETIGGALGARVTFTGQPFTPPQNYPAVYVHWLRSEPSATNYGDRQANDKLRARGIVRRHTFSVYVMLGLAPDGVSVSERQQEAGETVMQALEDDVTLRAATDGDRAARARVANVEAWNEAMDATAVFGVLASCEVSEL